jgi:hypothetical protein
MDFNSTIDLIIKDLNEASEIIDDLKKYPGVPALQVEFAKSKCKSAGEVIALLKNMNIMQAKAEPTVDKPVAAQKEEKIMPSAPKVQASPQAATAETVEEKAIPPIPVVPVEKLNEAKAGSMPASPRNEKKAEVKITEKKVEISVADKFTPKPDLYKEQLQGTEKDLSARLKSKPITNLSDAIGLNDRFLFIREVFEGNKDAYTQAISRLDKAENLQDAMAIIMSYTGEKPENEAVVQLLDLVRLKLPSNE